MPYYFSSTTGNIVRPIESLCLNASTGAIITPLRYGPAGTTITMWNGVVAFVGSGGTTRSTRSFALGSPSNFYDPTKAYDGDVNTSCGGQTGPITPNPAVQVWLCTQGQTNLAAVTLQIKRTYYTQTPTNNGLPECILECKWANQSSWHTLHVASGTTKTTLDYESFQIAVPQPPQIVENLSGMSIRCSVTGDYRWDEQLQRDVWTSAYTNIYDMYLEYSYT